MLGWMEVCVMWYRSPCHVCVYIYVCVYVCVCVASCVVVCDIQVYTHYNVFLRF